MDVRVGREPPPAARAAKNAAWRQHPSASLRAGSEAGSFKRPFMKRAVAKETLTCPQPPQPTTVKPFCEQEHPASLRKAVQGNELRENHAEQ